METRKEIFGALMGATPEELAIFASWGVDPGSVRKTPLGVSFEVNGFLHQGRVNVWSDPAGGLTVELYKDGEVTATETGVKLADLQRTVDYLVEYDPDRYDAMVEADPLCAMMMHADCVVFV